MDVDTPTADVVKQKIEELVARGNLRGAVVQCEELELLTAKTAFNEVAERWAKIHLALLLAVDDVNNGRHLWRRLPASAKGGDAELAALWGVGKCLWKRDMQGARTALKGRDWSAALVPYVDLVRKRLWERQLAIISNAFSSLPLEEVASLLGCSVDEAEGECAKEGWKMQAGDQRIVVPVARSSVESIPVTSPDYLQKMARHIAFLERQNLG